MNEYLLLSGCSLEIINIYKRYFIREGYQILKDNDRMILVKKAVKEDNINKYLEDNIIKVIMLYSERYDNRGSIFIDFSNNIDRVKKKVNLYYEEGCRKIDNNITWLIRHSFIEAYSNKFNKEMLINE